MDIPETYNAGEIVYIIIRNPHAQDVANVQEAAVVQNPENPEQLSLFVYETYYPLTDEVAIYKTKNQAEQAYREAFGSNGESFYG
ncbi:transcriptional regulator [Halobacillus shinanisalinarum]|uniref:Transcriptional regulator n=1 Tax=Halobacillus shinanisalinarum TaxID=2932258 RepID=A0ABY4H5I3_9BACI|nr:transcriptional regulator SplA domain-containing protein [Halobacillus shinanisalinarum]UOQ95466.1 transcriptional regulator [Halobacillus shinanisalinarum]